MYINMFVFYTDDGDDNDYNAVIIIVIFVMAQREREKAKENMVLHYNKPMIITVKLYVRACVCLLIST